MIFGRWQAPWCPQENENPVFYQILFFTSSKILFLARVIALQRSRIFCDRLTAPILVNFDVNYYTCTRPGLPKRANSSKLREAKTPEPQRIEQFRTTGLKGNRLRNVISCMKNYSDDVIITL